MLRCAEVLAELGNYLDDAVAADLYRDLRAHLAECRTCTAIYDSARKTLRITTESRAFDLPEAVSGRIVSKVLDRLRETGA